MKRKVDELGRYVLPIEMRRQLNISEKDIVGVSVQGTALVLEKKDTPAGSMVDELGRVKFPADVLEQLQIFAKDTLDATVQGNTIELVKIADSCIFCRNEEGLAEIESVTIYEQGKSKIGHFAVCEVCRRHLAKMQNGDVFTVEQCQ